jgi:hypothetical protein
MMAGLAFVTLTAVGMPMSASGFGSTEADKNGAQKKSPEGRARCGAMPAGKRGSSSGRSRHGAPAKGSIRRPPAVTAKSRIIPSEASKTSSMPAAEIRCRSEFIGASLRTNPSCPEPAHRQAAYAETANGEYRAAELAVGRERGQELRSHGGDEQDREIFAAET